MKDGAVIAGAIGVGVPLASAIIQPTWKEILAAGIGSISTAAAIVAYVATVDEVDETDAWFWLVGAVVGVGIVYAWKGPSAAAKAAGSVVATP